MNKPRSSTLILFWFGAVIFLSSACLLVLEIVASRLLAPYIGASLYTWTAIIGVILAGLSIGNWIGGFWADHGGGARAAGATLIAAALATLVIPYLLIPTADALQAEPISLMSASLVYVVVLFLVPALFLGIVTPLLTTLALGYSEKPGKIVGTMHALAALGSICGTFATGFWLIPLLGTRLIILITGGALALMGLSFLLRRKGDLALAVALPIGLTTAVIGLNGLRSPCDAESHYYCIRVLQDDGAFGEARTMVLDHMVHSINHRNDPQLLITSYVHAMDELLRINFRRNDIATPTIFFAGGGAYTQPRALIQRHPEAKLVVAEIDPMVTRIAADHLYVDMGNIDVRDQDARLVLPILGESSQDAIVTDVFHDVAVPWHLTTREFVAMVRSRLTPDGIYLMNVVDQFPDSKLVKAMLKTLNTEFSSVQIWLEGVPDQPSRMTYVISASNTKPFPGRLVADKGLPRAWFDVSTPLVKVGTPMDAIPLLTDDHAPVEKLVSDLIWTKLGT